MVTLMVFGKIILAAHVLNTEKHKVCENRATNNQKKKLHRYFLKAKGVHFGG